MPVISKSSVFLINGFGEKSFSYSTSATFREQSQFIAREIYLF